MVPSHKENRSIMLSILYKKIFEEKWPSELGGVLLALLNTLMFLYSGPIAATNAVIADWGRWIYNVALLNPQSVHFLQTSRYFPQSIMYIGLMLGVFLSALFAKQFSLKREKIGGYIQGFIGGALMGIGSFLAGACILGGLFSDIMGLSLSGFIMMAGLLAGAYIGGKFVMWQINRQADNLFGSDSCKVKTASEDHIVRKNYRDIQPKIAITVALLLLAIISVDTFNATGFPSAALVSGILFGIVFQRSAFCFAAAFREIFLTRTTRMMRSLIISLLIGAAGFSIIMAAGLRPTEAYVFHTSGRILFGSLIFGFGMTITGG